MAGSNTNVKTRPRIKINPDQKQREKVETPRNYRVILLNNPVTHFDAVVEVLRTVFQKSNAESVQIMWFTHQNGRGLVMISTREICNQKVQEARNFCLAQAGRRVQGYDMAYELLQFEVEEDNADGN